MIVHFDLTIVALQVGFIQRRYNMFLMIILMFMTISLAEENQSERGMQHVFIITFQLDEGVG